jgi:hypothetical protein
MWTYCKMEIDSSKRPTLQELLAKARANLSSPLTAIPKRKNAET